MPRDEEIIESLSEYFKTQGSGAYEEFKTILDLSDHDMDHLAALQSSAGLSILLRVFANRGNILLEQLRYKVGTDRELAGPFRTWQALIQVYEDLKFIPRMARDAVAARHEPTPDEILGGEDDE